MNRHYWYYRFLADVAWWNNTVSDIESSMKNLLLELTEDTGVAFGLLASERGAGQNFSVDISSGVAYDTSGRRLFNSGTTNVPFTTDALGNAVTCTGGGNSRVVSVYAYYSMVDSVPVVDGFSNVVQTVGTESIEFRLYQGTIATTGTQVPAANPNNGGVLLAHVTIATGDSTIATADCNNVPRDRLSPWPRSFETDQHLRVYSTGNATWDGASVITSAAINVHCMDKYGATKTGTIAAGTFALSDGQCLILRLDRSNTGIVYASVTYGSMAAAKYAITAESNLGVTDYLHKDDIIIFRRRGTNLEIPFLKRYIPTPSLFTLGKDCQDLSEATSGKVQTTDATITDLLTIAVAQGEAYMVEAMVVARKTDGTQFGAWKIVGLFHRNSASNVTQDGLTSVLMGEVSDTYSCEFAADTGNQTIDLRVTGKAATTINWSGSCKALRVT